MKLWKKLSLVMVSLLFIAMLVSGAAVIYYSAEYNQEKTIENYEQQLKSTVVSLEKELETGLLAGYSGTTMNSYVNFLIKKFGASKYILIKGSEELGNLTPYKLANPEDERWGGEEPYSIIQNTGKQYILITGQRISVGADENYRLMLVQDISRLYEDVGRQALNMLFIYLGAAFAAVILIFLITRKLLSPLRELERAASDISDGELKRRAKVHTRDEVGRVAKTFNVMAEQIEEQVRSLEQESERRRQLLGSLTHELKTPMTSIIGYSDTLLHVNLKKEQQQRALYHIKEQCSRLERLGSKLMSLMGLYDNDSICMEEASMEELFEQAAQLEKHSLGQKGIKLEYSCTMGNRRVDKDLFLSLLINLIDNSAKASSEGDTIYLIGEKDRIAVKDQGCGIPREEIDRVTEAFYMVDKARSRKAGGCGLGLALCSQIARLHGARLVIESELGKGTSVWINFGES